MTATTAFLASLGTLVLFLAFKLLENSRELSMYNTFRKKGDAVVVSAISNVQAKVRKMEHNFSVNNIVRIFVHYIASVIARAARGVEVRAKDVTRKISRNGNGRARETKSSFLEEVSTHKENLDTERIRRETSFTRLREDANGQAENNEQ